MKHVHWVQVFRCPQHRAVVLRKGNRGIRVQGREKHARQSRTDVVQNGRDRRLFARLFRMCPGCSFTSLLLIHQKVRAIFTTCNQFVILPPSFLLYSPTNYEPVSAWITVPTATSLCHPAPWYA